MIKVAKIAYRNLLRYSRRTLLTSTLIVIGIVAVLLFVSIAGSFKHLMIGQITDSMLGHIQIHRKGFLASIDNSPLNLNLNVKQVNKLKEVLSGDDRIIAYSQRLKFSGMLSNFTETSNMRINAVVPTQELETVPLLRDRVQNHQGEVIAPSLKPGEVWVPETLAKGMKIKIGDSVVLVATNKNNSVNGINLTVSGIVSSMTGPGGRDGYMNIVDGYQILQITEVKKPAPEITDDLGLDFPDIPELNGTANSTSSSETTMAASSTSSKMTDKSTEKGQITEINELVLRIASFDEMEAVYTNLSEQLLGILNQQKKPVFEVHTWDKLSPFSSIANIIDMMTIFVKIILIAIVLVSVMNVMLMAVYERIREIGTIAAIGTTPRRIWNLFLMEGFFLGLFGTILGVVISLVTIQILNWVNLTVSFGRNNNMLLAPTISPSEVVTTALIVIIISALASLQPAVKASKLEPVDALRHL